MYAIDRCVGSTCRPSIHWLWLRAMLESYTSAWAGDFADFSISGRRCLTMNVSHAHTICWPKRILVPRCQRWVETRYTTKMKVRKTNLGCFIVIRTVQWLTDDQSGILTQWILFIHWTCERLIDLCKLGEDSIQLDIEVRFYEKSWGGERLYHKVLYCILDCHLS